MRALITGITGQDGSYLADFLLEKGYEVYGLVRRLSRPNYSNIRHILNQIKIIDGDILDYGSISNAIYLVQPDEIYHLAAQSFVGTSFKQPIFTGDATGLGVLRVLEVVRMICPNARVYNASTSELFGATNQEPLNENSPFSPRSPYAVAKLYGYWIAKNYRESYKMYVTNGILFNHESPRRGMDFVTRKISYNVAAIAKGMLEKIELGNIDAMRDWGYAPEYVESMWLMLQEDKPDDFVVATGEKHSVKEFVELAFNIVGITNWEKYVEIDKRFLRPSDVPSLKGDSSKARKILGWEPRTKFKELVKIMVESDLNLLNKNNILGE